MTITECEVCGVPATECVADIIVEDSPIPDSKGQVWWAGHLEGENHFYCNAHYKPPKYVKAAVAERIGG